MMLIQFYQLLEQSSTILFQVFKCYMNVHSCLKCRFVFCVIVCIYLCLCKSYTCTCVHMQVENTIWQCVYTY